jgi:hypothetical protein
MPRTQCPRWASNNPRGRFICGSLPSLGLGASAQPEKDACWRTPGARQQVHYGDWFEFAPIGQAIRGIQNFPKFLLDRVDRRSSTYPPEEPLPGAETWKFPSRTLPDMPVAACPKATGGDHGWHWASRLAAAAMPKFGRRGVRGRDRPKTVSTSRAVPKNAHGYLVNRAGGPCPQTFVFGQLTCSPRGARRWPPLRGVIRRRILLVAIIGNMWLASPAGQDAEHRPDVRPDGGGPRDGAPWHHGQADRENTVRSYPRSGRGGLRADPVPGWPVPKPQRGRRCLLSPLARHPGAQARETWHERIATLVDVD